MPYIRAQRVMANFANVGGGMSFGARLGTDVPFSDPSRVWPAPSLSAARDTAGAGDAPMPPGGAVPEGRTDAQPVAPAAGTQGEQPPSPTGVAQQRPAFRMPVNQLGLGQLGVDRARPARSGLATARTTYATRGAQ